MEISELLRRQLYDGTCESVGVGLAGRSAGVVMILIFLA